MTWLLIDWHWLMIIVTIITLLVLGIAVFGEDDNGDWFIW
jgi:hypothetical protein